MDDESNHVRQLRVYCSQQGSVDVSKGRTRHLSLHYSSGQKSLPAHQVLSEKLHDDVRYVRDIDFIDNTVDRLPELLPHELLVGLAILALLLHLLKQSSHFEGRHVNSTGVDCLSLRRKLDNWLLDFFLYFLLWR